MIVSGHVLDMRDRHDGNIGMVSNNRLANIDFGWTKRGPPFDTAPFCIPAQLRELCDEDGQWSVLHDVCWDAIKALQQNEATICDAWVWALRKVSLCDSTLMETDSMSRRLNITRRVLDDEMDSTKNRTQSLLKIQAMHLKEWEGWRAIMGGLARVSISTRSQPEPQMPAETMGSPTANLIKVHASSVDGKSKKTLKLPRGFDLVLLKGKLESAFNAHVDEIEYTDDEGDGVAIADDDDLKVAQATMTSGRLELVVGVDLA